MSVESNPGLNWFCFTVLFDWSRKLAPPSQPIRCKLKPIAPWSLAFSRATGRLHAFTSSCHWLPLIISFTLIGRGDYFVLVFDTQLKSALNQADYRIHSLHTWRNNSDTRVITRGPLGWHARAIWQKMLNSFDISRSFKL